MPLRRRQRGIALLTAFFVVVLATIAAVAMFEGSNIGTQRAANLGESEAAWWYAVGVETWVSSTLKLDKGDVDGLGDPWAQPVDFLPIDNGGLRGHLEDLQGRFNLNNLVFAATDPTKLKQYEEQFQLLLASLPDFDASKYANVVGAVRDWVDADSDRSSLDGAEDGEYLTLDPPYRAANQPMHSPSELLLVKGVTPELYRALRPYVTALPAPTPININTAPLPVLLSLGTNIDKSCLERFLEVRKKQPLKDVREAQGGGALGCLPAQTVPLSVNTRYFLLQAEVFVGRGRVALYSVISRQGGGQPNVIAHSTDTE